MKNLLLMLLVSCTVQISFAGLSTHDFNDMIQENQKSEKDLRKKLQKTAGVDPSRDDVGKIDHSKIEKPKDVEQFAVSSGSVPSYRQPKQPAALKESSRAAMKRLADEMLQAESK